MIHLTTVQQKDLVTKILIDSIIYERTYNGVNEIMRAFNPDTEAWEADSYYTGIFSCFTILGYNHTFEDEKVTDILFKNFSNKFKDDFNKPYKERSTAKALAEKIYIDWCTIMEKQKNYLTLKS